MDSGKWLYHTPNFESDNYNLEMMKYAPWSGHRGFAYDYVCNMKPNVIVELGSHYGCSAFTFLQAIKDYNLQTKFYAIDTWVGDKYTENDYIENIFEEYKRVQTVCFAHQNKEMMRMTFDEAVVFFEDNSIDLLHIDGSHIYNDVKHDFELWKDKVKKDGVIFLHDIAEDTVLGEKMGSHFFWNELKREYSFVEFQYSYGLGIIFLDRRKWELFFENVDLDYYSKNALLMVNEYKDKLRRDFFEIRERDKHIEALYKQIDVLHKHLKNYEITTKEKDEYINELEVQKSIVEIQSKEAFEEIEQINKVYENNLSAYEETIQGKDCYISELETQKDFLEEQCRVLSEKIEQVGKEYENNLSAYEEIMQGKNDYISELENQKGVLEEQCRNLHERIMQINKEYEKNLSAYKGTVQGKDCYISELEQKCNQLFEDIKKINQEYGENISKYQDTVKGKDSYIFELESNIEKLNEFVNSKEKYIEELTNWNNQLEKVDCDRKYLVKQLQSEIVLKQTELEKQGQKIEAIKAEMKKLLFGKKTLERLEKNCE